jgi:hypothetical protein
VIDPVFCGFSKSVMGASHEKSGKVCQDSSDCKVAESYAIAVVADGHGSKKHFRSNMGSRFAVEATIETVDKFYEDTEEFEKNFPVNHKMIIKNIEKQIISVWDNKVTEHLKNNPVTDEEKKDFTEEEFSEIAPESFYGTTLIAAVAGRNYTFGMQIGDGSLVAIFEDGAAVMPMEYEESAPANITASICNASASSMFNSFYIADKKLLSVFVSTDGLYTSFGREADFLSYHTIITSQLAESDDFGSAVYKNLVKRSHFGTEDDISLSCVYNKENVIEKSAVLKQKVNESKRK